VTPAPPPVTLEIGALGGQGDGLARWQDRPVFVPLTVPGDRVLAQLGGRRGDGLAASLITVIEAGPDRVHPPCPLFGRCGGCSLQQLAPPSLALWKRDRLVSALRRCGVAADQVQQLIAIAPGSRRRAAFAFLRRRQGMLVGFNQRASAYLIDVDPCLLLAPPLRALLPSLRQALTECAGLDAGDALATLSDSGIDLVIDTETKLDLATRQRLAQFAEQSDLARLSWRHGGITEPVAQRRPVQLAIGKVAVALPPGAFLQPSAAGAAALVALVLAPLSPRSRVADLYAGSGSFTVPLAQAGHSVHAIEGDQDALAALDAAARGAGLRITTERRDLARQPLLGAELARFDALLFDPPRAGAAAQAMQLAKAGPPLLLAVSCNPATLARDAMILIGGGYRLVSATPVDQFPWSAHLEAVALFQR
jgi:23S rRNA (uracil1939-C5)-methyltransferase